MSVPFRRTRRTPCTSPTGDPSTESQSIDGGGLPDAEQSSHPPLEFENSNFGGGSNRKLGPRRWESNPDTQQSSPVTERLRNVTCIYLLIIQCGVLFYLNDTQDCSYNKKKHNDQFTFQSANLSGSNWLNVYSVIEMSADISCSNREHPCKYCNTMNLGWEMHC